LASFFAPFGDFPDVLPAIVFTPGPLRRSVTVGLSPRVLSRCREA
jgi:hypothetical protein